MSVITLFSGAFCHEDAVADEVHDQTGYQRFTDKEIVRRAAELSGMPEQKIQNAFTSKTSVFNRFTHEKERAVAHLRMAVAELLDQDNLLITGFSGLLIPKNVTHALSVCLVADISSRIETLKKDQMVSEKEALNILRRKDADAFFWIKQLYGKDDPWDASLFDIVLPMDKTPLADAVALILENARSSVVEKNERSEKASADFYLAAAVETALTQEGHNVGVEAKDGKVILTIYNNVLMLSRLEEELKSIAAEVPDVKDVTTKVGEGFHQTDIYRRVNFEAPSKVLLVDDEREFVQTLSERLLMRDMGSAVAFDGESALDIVNADEPEVMILDLKMPGIDGIEVLRRVKQDRPEIEVIILTGHGSDADKKICMDLGAFAYLQKPVDIELLSDTLKAASAKMQAKGTSAS